MLWFQKKKKHQHEDLRELERQVVIEVEHHKDASAKKVAETKKITDNFNRIINQNNFTLTIRAAAGGGKQKAKQHGH